MKASTVTLAATMVAALCIGGIIVLAGDEKKAPVITQQAKDLAAADNQFGVDLLKQLHVAGENRFMSPSSIAIAMQMATQGSGGATREELITAMHTGKLDLNESNRGLLDALADREGVKLCVANALWSDPKRVSLNKEYVAEMAKYFDAEVRVSNFSDPATVAEVNEWIAGKTEQLIKDMLTELDPEDIALLINAIYFKGDWSTKFDKAKTHEADFHLHEGSSRIQMMERSGKIAYTEDDGTQIVKLPYGEDKNMAMWVALPAKDSSLDELVKQFEAADLQTWRKRAYESQGTLKLPRMKVRYNTSLVPALKELGIKSAFNSDGADFSRFGQANGNIYISDVLHEAVMIVDEEGTEAAAATIVKIAAKSAPEEPWNMVCNRPYLVLITDELTGAILFTGTIYNPQTE